MQTRINPILFPSIICEAFRQRHDANLDIRQGSREAFHWYVAARRMVTNSHRAPTGPFRAQVARIILGWEE